MSADMTAVWRGQIITGTPRGRIVTSEHEGALTYSAQAGGIAITWLVGDGIVVAWAPTPPTLQEALDKLSRVVRLRTRLARVRAWSNAAGSDTQWRRSIYLESRLEAAIAALEAA